MTGVHVKLPLESSRISKQVEEDGMPYLPHDQPIPPFVLGRRRHAISGGPESLYNSRPRMKRRGAISYETNDTAAQYIRYLGAYGKRTLKPVFSQLQLVFTVVTHRDVAVIVPVYKGDEKAVVLTYGGINQFVIDLLATSFGIRAFIIVYTYGEFECTLVVTRLPTSSVLILPALQEMLSIRGQRNNTWDTYQSFPPINVRPKPCVVLTALETLLRYQHSGVLRFDWIVAAKCFVGSHFVMSQYLFSAVGVPCT